ncbi:MAG: radical SAM protein [Chromatiaceae bacterium]|jgi:radical SAM superfamily enzyme YgiQ (UPF0313 family)|nr:radical SAM protein [Chromatiaceae bacterium]
MTIFHLVLIRPSHYDSEGYVIQWLRSGIPSNTLAALNGLAEDCAARKVLGDDVEIRVTPIDEANTKVDVERLARMIECDGGHGLIGLAGVQTNQYPRALDIGRRCREKGLQVCIGGFHVSGILAMLPEPTPELEQATDLGISLYAGESETRFDEVLVDAYNRRLEPLYNYLNDLPNIDGEPPPFMPVDRVYKTLSKVTSFDAGRGCPFVCSFCSIINVHGRRSRFRGPNDVERVIRANKAQGISRFFITDDNFARNKNWEVILDRIIELREKEGMEVRLTIQVDVQCHRIPRFIDKCVAAGVKRVFIGLESINPENLAAANKKQNRITEYRTMFQAWRAAKVFTDVGYIIGFPGDTPASVVRDIGIMQRELPIDRIEFTAMTPLPGSADHKAMFDRGAYMDPDLNKYDLWNVTTHHPRMSDQEFRRTYQLAWKTYYSDEHIITNLKRARASGISIGKVLGSNVHYALVPELEGIHPLEAGLFRVRRRKDRRPGMAIENPLVFYPKYSWRFVRSHWKAARVLLKFHRVRKALDADPDAVNYTDRALTPVSEKDLEELEMFSQTDAARVAVQIHQEKQRARA